MLDQYSSIAIGYLLMITAVSVYLRRAWGVSYDRRVLMSNFLAVTSLVFFKVGTQLSFSELPDAPIVTKVLGTIVTLLVIFGVMQLVFWLVYLILRNRDWLKIPRFLFNMITLILMIGCLIFLLKYVFDYPLSSLLVTSTVLSAIIGLALQDTLSNLFAGIALQIESPFSLDEWVNLGGFEGKVVEQNWRTVTINTRENHRISLTNKFVGDDKIVNFSRPTRRQIHNFYIELDYSHPPNFVKEVLENLLIEVEEVHIDEATGVFVVDYMESGIKYCLKYWLHDYADIVAIEDEVLTRLWYALRRDNIKIPYPTSEIQMQLVNNEEGTEKQLDKSFVAQYLSRLEWLADMDNENINKLSQECSIKLYAKDDLVVRQGEPGDSMFIILSGSVRVSIWNEQRTGLIEVATKEAGEFFGEMSLLSGEPRTAFIHAREDSDVIMIDRTSFSTLIASDETILQELVETLLHSKSGLAKALESEKNKSKGTEKNAVNALVGRIRGYFMLDTPSR